MRASVVLAIFLSSIVLIYLFLLLTNSKPQSNPKDDLLSKITRSIINQTANLNDNPPSCQNDTTDGLISSINNNITKGNQIRSDTASDPPTPTSIEAFKAAVSVALQLIKQVSSLPRCSCPQGTYEDGKCNCPSNYPYSITTSDGIIYCSNVNCPSLSNGKFIPGGDSSQNSCDCDPAYILSQTDPSNPNSIMNCYNKANTEALNAIVDQINKDSNSLKQYSP